MIQIPFLRRFLLMAVMACGQVLSSPSDWRRIENPTAGGQYRSIQHTPLGWFAVGTKGLVKFSPDARKWFWSQGDPSIPSGRDYRGIGHFKGMTYVAGDSGTVVRTADGRNWEHFHLGDSFRLASIASNGTELVVVGNNCLFRSLDGETWQRRSFSQNADWRSIVSATGGFLAVSRSGSLGFSIDGLNWSEKVEPSFLFDRLVVNGSEILALGRRRMDSAMNQMSAPTAIARSTDGGISWAADTSWIVPEELGPRLSALHHDGTRWYGVTDVGTILTSPDGLLWTYDTLQLARIQIDQGDYYNDLPLAYGVGIWMGIGPSWSNSGLSDNLGMSRDLRTWDPVTSSTFEDHAVLLQSWRGDWWVVRSEGNYRQSPTAVHKTRDFVHWEEAFVGLGFPLHLDTVGTEIHLGGAYISCRVDTAMLSSCEPSRPRHTAFGIGGGLKAEAVAYGDFGVEGVALTRWTSKGGMRVDSVKRRGAVFSLKRFGARWVVAGRGWIGWATDEGDWRVVDVPSGEYQMDMATDGKVLVLTSDTAKVLRSTDGENWSVVRTGTTGSFYQIVWNGRFFTGVGDQGVMGWSKDGSSWLVDTVTLNYLPGFTAISSGLSKDTVLVGVAGGEIFRCERDWEGMISASTVRPRPRLVPVNRFVDAKGRLLPKSGRSFKVGDLDALPVR